MRYQELLETHENSHVGQAVSDFIWMFARFEKNVSPGIRGISASEFFKKIRLKEINDYALDKDETKAFDLAMSDAWETTEFFIDHGIDPVEMDIPIIADVDVDKAKYLRARLDLKNLDDKSEILNILTANPIKASPRIKRLLKELFPLHWPWFEKNLKPSPQTP